MAKHKLKVPLRVGDIETGIMVDALELVSVAINFQPALETPKDQSAHIKFWRERVVVSCMLRHPGSDWIHTVTLGEHTQKHEAAKAVWAQIKAKFPDFEREILMLLAEHLPEGVVE